MRRTARAGGLLCALLVVVTGCSTGGRKTGDVEASDAFAATRSEATLGPGTALRFGFVVPPSARLLGRVFPEIVVDDAGTAGPLEDLALLSVDWTIDDAVHDFVRQAGDAWNITPDHFRGF